MIHSPAFDYNIMLLDCLSSKIIDTFSNILTWHGTSYESPSYLSTAYNFDVNKSYYTVRITWGAITKNDLMSISDNIWDVDIVKNRAIVQHYSKVSTGYIFDMLRSLFCQEENQ